LHSVVLPTGLGCAFRDVWWWRNCGRGIYSRLSPSGSSDNGSIVLRSSEPNTYLLTCNQIGVKGVDRWVPRAELRK
jgi:hypothetical protein